VGRLSSISEIGEPNAFPKPELLPPQKPTCNCVQIFDLPQDRNLIGLHCGKSFLSYLQINNIDIII